MFRRTFALVIKKLINRDLGERDRSGWSNLLISLPFMFLQYEGSRQNLNRCTRFLTLLQSEDVISIKVGDFAKKTQKSNVTLNKKYDFMSRCHEEADANVKAGDYSKAMQSLLKVNARMNINTVEQNIKDSPPDRNYGELSDDQRRALYSHVDLSDASPLVTTKDVLYQLRRIKKNRSPGVDGMSIEHLNSIFLGGNRDEVFKREVLKDYVEFLNKWFKSDLTDSQ